MDTFIRKNHSLRHGINQSVMGLMITLSATSLVLAEKATPLKAIAQLPIKEVTVFKDGHAFVLHQGKMPVNPSGKVVMDYLPAPVLGTYWPFSRDQHATLRSVTAGKRKTLIAKTALTIREMIEANIGADVMITERPATPGGRETPPFYQATILEIPTRSGEEIEAFSPTSSDDKLPEKSDLVMVKTDHGIKALAMERILDITFTDQRKNKVTNEEFRNMLTLDMKWKGKAKSEVDVGMIYLQRGLRWIPSYKIDIDGEGKAIVKLEATLVNELTDFKDEPLWKSVLSPGWTPFHLVAPVFLAVVVSIQQYQQNHLDDNSGA